MKTDINKELSLLLDCKTRWSSLLTMLERFLEVKSSIQKSLIDIKVNITLDDDDFKLLTEIVNALKPVALAVQAICRTDANLIMADAVIKLTLDKLVQQDTVISYQIVEAITRRIGERRTDMSSILQFLHTGKIPTSTDCAIFKKITKKQIYAKLQEIIARLYPSCQQGSEQPGPSKQTTPTPLQGLKLQQEFDKIIESANIATHQNRCQDAKNLESTIKKEIALFENGGTKGHHLQLSYNCLKSIQPTSVESERAFSSAGSLCTKIRSRLNGRTMDDLCFLRAHFRNLDSNEKVNRKRKLI